MSVNLEYQLSYPLTGPSRTRQVDSTQLGEVPIVRAVEFIQRMRGDSQPQLLRGDNEVYYVVKFRNNPQHVRILANEMVAARLARLIGLPVPKPAFMDVSHELITGNSPLEIVTRTWRAPCASGLHFGSCLAGVPGETQIIDFLPDRLLKRVKDLGPTFLGAFVFDKWTCNCDGRQVVFTRPADGANTTFSPWLIDHGLCFNGCEWNFPDSPIRSIYHRRLVYESASGLHSFEPILSRIENLEARQIEMSAEGIPSDWYGDEPEKLMRLHERLYERCRRVRQLIIDAKNSSLRPFPNWK